MLPRLSFSEYYDGILSGNRLVLSRAITLIESSLPADKSAASTLIEAILPYTGNSLRVGITGVPGVGKSTFIEALGGHLTQQGKKLAVLAIDPSSVQTGGSILGDKTRMETLTRNPRAYIRPTPAGGTLGGVAHQTRATILLCEAAGYDIVLVETVGVGQSETVVREMTDFFLLLMLAGAGDELQGLKRGIIEMADALIITKATSGNESAVREAVLAYQNALHLFPKLLSGWMPPVTSCSAIPERGIAEVWAIVENYHAFTLKNGYFVSQRASQRKLWLKNYIRQEIENRYLQRQDVQAYLQQIENPVASGELSAWQATEQLFAILDSKP